MKITLIGYIQATKADLPEIMVSDKRTYFDRLAPDWDDIVHHDPSKLEYIVSLLELKRGDFVLDVGCGTGVTIPYIFHYVEKNGAITAVDFSAGMLEIARKKLTGMGISNIEYVAEEVNNLGMARQYDAILCYSCFPHFDDQSATLRHLANGLKPGGGLMIAHSEPRAAINQHHRNADPVVKDDYLPPLDEVIATIENAGLVLTHSEDNDKLFLVLAKYI
jgi:demethylmenaquinone methyltransferase/2-methoxy-6-polyprenyl-1,4-benzoquinol methylase